MLAKSVRGRHDSGRLPSRANWNLHLLQPVGSGGPYKQSLSKKLQMLCCRRFEHCPRLHVHGMEVTLRHHDHQTLFEVHEKVQAAVECDMGQLQAQMLHVGKDVPPWGVYMGALHSCWTCLCRITVCHIMCSKGPVATAGPDGDTHNPHAGKIARLVPPTLQGRCGSSRG